MSATGCVPPCVRLHRQEVSHCSFVASHLQFWANVIKVGYNAGRRNLCTLVCLGSGLCACVCVCMDGSVCFGVWLRCWTQVFTLALGLGLRTLACWRQLQSVSRCGLSSAVFGSLVVLPLAPCTAVAWPTEQSSPCACMNVCVCVCSCT